MIAKLTGLVDLKGEGWAIIDVSGVGYLVFCSSRTLSYLESGVMSSLVIETHVREDHIHLYGFLEQSECDWFKLLTTVQGVGAKVALGILSVIGDEELFQAIISSDKTTITRAPGVGPKLAVRLLTELKDKVAIFSTGLDADQDGSNMDLVQVNRAVSNTISEAVSALVNLGYSASHSLTAVNVAIEKLDDNIGLEDLIRATLAELAPVKKDPS